MPCGSTGTAAASDSFPATAHFLALARFAQRCSCPAKPPEAGSAVSNVTRKQITGWRYDLALLGPSETEVTLTCDCSAVPQFIREDLQFPPFGPEHLTNSMHHLPSLPHRRPGSNARRRLDTWPAVAVHPNEDAGNTVGDRYAAWLDIETPITEKPDLMRPV
jgi:hypothetical protein